MGEGTGAMLMEVLTITAAAGKAATIILLW